MEKEIERELDKLWEFGVKALKTDFQRLESKVNKVLVMMITQFVSLLIGIIIALLTLKG